MFRVPGGSNCPHSNQAFDITKSTPPNMLCSVSMFISATHPKTSKNASGAQEKSSQSTKFTQQKKTIGVPLLQKISLKKNPSNNFHSFPPKLLMNLIPSGHHLSFPHRRRPGPTAAYRRYRRHPRRRGTRRRWRCWRVCCRAIGNSMAEEPWKRCWSTIWWLASLTGSILQYMGGFLKWWYPTTMGFPIKYDHFGVFWGYHYLRKHPYIP